MNCRLSPVRNKNIPVSPLRFRAVYPVMASISDLAKHCDELKHRGIAFQLYGEKDCHLFVTSEADIAEYKNAWGTILKRAEEIHQRETSFQARIENCLDQIRDKAHLASVLMDMVKDFVRDPLPKITPEWIAYREKYMPKDESNVPDVAVLTAAMQQGKFDPLTGILNS